MSLALDATDEAVILTVPMFADSTGDEVYGLLEAAYVSSHPDGGLLFSRGDRADRFFVVLTGRVNLCALTSGGEQSIIEVVDKGQSFAEAAIFASARYPLNAEMVPGTRILEIPAQPFLKRLGERRGLTGQILASLARWERRLMTEIADLKGRSPVQRLGLFLLALAEPSGDNKATVQLPLTKSELASRIGVTPESLSRAVARLKPLGVISHGRQFLIDDVAGLRKFCGGD
jgi:CRP/FNR family transcriptional regulator, dissimilatory nitrate respiration regulator